MGLEVLEPAETKGRAANGQGKEGVVPVRGREHASVALSLDPGDVGKRKKGEVVAFSHASNLGQEVRRGELGGFEEKPLERADLCHQVKVIRLSKGVTRA